MRAQTARAPACAYDIDITWGETSLCSEHVAPAVPFVLASSAHGPNDARVFVVDEAWLEETKQQVVFVEHGAPWVARGGVRARLEPGVEIVTRVGPLEIRVRGAEPQQVAALHASQLDLDKQRWTLASFALHLLALGCMALLPPKASSLSLDMATNDVARMQYLLTPVEAPPPDPFAGRDKTGAAEPAPQLGEPGPVKNAPSRGQRRSKRAEPSCPDCKTAEKANVANTGILGVLPGVTAMLGPDGPFSPGTLGYDPEAKLAALLGQLGQEGPGGFLKTPGRGGGGDPNGAIGVGPLHTKPGDGPGIAGNLGMPTHDARVPRVKPSGEADVHGSLAKETIRREIQRHLNEVRFCYEEALRSAPELAGRVSIGFLIAPSGVVQMASLDESSLGSSAVEQCVVQAVRRWSFPAPEGGGYVRVSYPFLFEAAGR
jgi:TonB family protein